jgi:hypothetical protein
MECILFLMENNLKEIGYLEISMDTVNWHTQMVNLEKENGLMESNSSMGPKQQPIMQIEHWMIFPKLHIYKSHQIKDWTSIKIK